MGGWNPWRALRAREHLRFRLASLDEWDLDAVYWPRDGRALIVVDDKLDRRSRAAALTHELVHDERGGGCACPDDAPDGWRAILGRDEAAVRAESARRLVPLDDLEEFCRRAVEVEGGVTKVMVAEEFDTTEEMAELSLLLLIGRIKEAG